MNRLWRVFAFALLFFEIPGSISRADDPPVQKPVVKEAKPLRSERELAIENLLAEMAEKDGYSLVPGQPVGRVASPFRAAREKLYPYFTTRRGTRQGFPFHGVQIPWSMAFEWNGKQLAYRHSMIGTHMHLSQLCFLSRRFEPHEIEIASQLTVTELTGDWILSESGSDEEFAFGLQAILQDDLQLPIQVQIREVEREVYIARGKYEFTPLPGFEVKPMGQTEAVHASDQIQFCSEQPDPNSSNWFNGPRSCSQMIRALSVFLREQIIDETDPPANASVSWRFHHAHTGADQVLKSVTRQTGLSFEKETRQVRRLLVEERRE